VAKLVGPLHSIAASGKLGPLIYSRNQYGFYTWEPPAYVDNPTQNQIDWRAAFAAAVTAWESGAGMTNALRDMWTEFAQNYPQYDRLGRKFTGTGRQRFIQNNITRLYAGLSFHAAPPVHPTCRIFPIVTLSQEDAGLYATLNPVLAGDDLFVCSSVLNQSLLRNFMPHSQTTAGVFKSGDSHPFLIAENALLDSEEKRHFFKWRCVDGDGRPGPQQINYIDGAQISPPSIWLINNDTKILENFPTTNYGTLNTFSVGEAAGPKLEASLLFCDLSSITPHPAPANAKLWIYCSGLNGTLDIGVHDLLVSWIDVQSTWNNRITGTAWGAPGGQAGIDFTTAAENIITVDTAAQWYPIEITTMCSSWLTGASSNLGLLLRYVSGSHTAIFRSSNYADPNFVPYLEFIW